MLKYFFKTSHPDVAKGQRVPTLPKTQHTELLDLATCAEHVVQYHQAFSWPEALSDYLHPAYLAMHALQAQAPLILDPGQPFAAMGLVHMSNTMHFTRLPKCDEVLSITYEFGHLWEQKRGWVFTVVTQAQDASQNIILTLESHYLSRAKQRCHSESIGQYEPNKITIPDMNSVAYEQTTYALPVDLGRRYAKLSGDYNPIHLHPLLSRWFGFKQPIIHGMWSKARALSEMAQAWGVQDISQAMRISVQFTDFIPLPNSVVLHSMRDSQRCISVGLPPNIALMQKQRPYFVVEVVFIDAVGDKTVGDDSLSVSG